MNTKTTAILVAACAALALCAPAAAQTVIVCNNSVQCGNLAVDVYPDLGAAITALNDPNVPIDRILVLERTITHTATIPPIMMPVTIEGAGFVPDVIIEGNMGTGQVLDVQADDVTIEGLTLRGGTVGVRVGAANTIINRCIIDGVETGIEVESTATGTIIGNCGIFDATADGVKINNTATTTVVSCTILGSANYGVSLTTTTGRLSLYNTILRNSGMADLFQEPTANGANIQSDGNDYSTRSLGAGFTVGALDIDVAPGFETVAPKWPGQLTIGATPNTVENKGADISTLSVPPEVLNFDLEGNARPADEKMFGPLPTTIYDIGADEIGLDGGAIGGWIYSEVIPEPVGSYAANSLLVLLQFEGTVAPGTFPSYLNALGSWRSGNKIVIVPELLLGNTADSGFFTSTEVDEYTIPIEVLFESGGFVVGTNAVAIDSIIDVTAYSNVVMDGLGEIHVFDGMDKGYIGPDPTDIEVLIDTIAPQLQVPALPDGLSGADFIMMSNDLVSAGELLPIGIPGAFPANWPGMFDVSTSSGLVTSKRGGAGAKAFFNLGADGIGTTLNFDVKATFVDGEPVDDNGDPITTVELGGFEVYNAPAVAGAAATQLEMGSLDYMSSPLWFIDEGASYLGSATSVSVDVVGVLGTEILSTPRFRSVNVTWHFTNVPYEEGFHIKTRLGGRDAAGNETAASDLLDPLTIWWMQDATTILSPYYNSEVPRPEFQWELLRTAEPGPSSPADPIFRFRVWAALNANSVDGLTPNYAAVNDGALTSQGLLTVGALTTGGGVSGWSPAWTRERGLGYNWFLRADGLLQAGYVNRWLILQVIGADEAGNVSPYAIPDFTAASGANWQRFKITTGDLVNTKMSATFWHDRIDSTTSLASRGKKDGGEDSFGQTTIVPLPEEQYFRIDPSLGPVVDRQVAGEFTVVSETPLGALSFVRVYVYRAEDPQTPIADGFYNVGTSPGRFTSKFTFAKVLPNPDTPPSYMGVRFINNFTQDLVGDILRKDAQTFTVRAITYFYDAASQLVEDPHPAQFTFTVVPNVADYIENKTDPDDQPVKVIESN